MDIVVGGLMVGALYALFNLGLVLTYRQSGVINFAQGAVATVSTVVAYEVMAAGFPWWVGVIAAIGTGATVQALMELLVISRMPWASEWTAAVSAVGVALLLVGLVEVTWGDYPEPLPQQVPQSVGFHVGGVYVSGQEVLALGLAVAVTAGLLLLVERSRFGLMLRAASEGPVTAQMLGLPVERVRTISWAIAGAVAGLAGVVITPAYQLDPETLTIFSIGAFAGVVLGGLESIWGTLIGSLVVGVGFSYVTYLVGGTWLYPASLVIVMIVLVFRPYGIFGRRLKRVPEPSLPSTVANVAWLTAMAPLLAGWVQRAISRPWVAIVSSWRERRARRTKLAGNTWLLGWGGLAVLVLVVPPLVVGSSLIFDFALVAATYPAVLGQKVISGDSGQISVGTSGFMVVGGYAFTELILRAHVGIFLALLGAMVMSALVGAALNLVGGRLHGGYLALVTLLFALAVPQIGGGLGTFTGGFSGLGVPPVSIGAIKLSQLTSMYVASTALALLAAVVVGQLTRGAVGRRWHAVRDTEVGAAACGMRVARIKAEAFAFGGLLAGLGGAATAVLVAFMSPTSYTFWNSIYLLAAVVVGGQSSLFGALVGTALIELLPVATAGAGGFPDVIFGAAVVAMMLFSPNGVIGGRRAGRAARSLTVVPQGLVTPGEGSIEPARSWVLAHPGTGGQVSR